MTYPLAFFRNRRNATNALKQAIDDGMETLLTHVRSEFQTGSNENFSLFLFILICQIEDEREKPDSALRHADLLPDSDRRQLTAIAAINDAIDDAAIEMLRYLRDQFAASSIDEFSIRLDKLIGDIGKETAETSKLHPSHQVAAYDRA